MTRNNGAPVTPASQTLPAYRVLADAIGVRITRFLLRTFGFRRTIAFLGAVPPMLRTVNDAEPIWAQEIAFVSRWRYGASCLDRSVFLWFILAQHGITGDLKIGVATSNDGIDGHAWVEHAGYVLNDQEDIADTYAVFDEDPIGIVFR